MNERKGKKREKRKKDLLEESWRDHWSGSGCLLGGFALASGHDEWMKGKKEKKEGRRKEKVEDGKEQEKITVSLFLFLIF